MPARHLALLIFILTLHARPLWAAEATTLTQLSFDRPTEIDSVTPPARGLGPTGSIKNGVGGFGLTLELPQADKWLWWNQLSYGSSLALFKTQFSDYKEGFQTQYFNMRVKDRFAISTGFDRQFPLSRRHKWALVAGAGASLARSHVEVTSYPKICGFWCGFDSNRPSYDSKIDWALLGYLRFGIRLNDVWGSGFNSALMIVTRPLRVPKFVELATVQDGRKQVNPDADGYFQIETTYRF